MWGLFLQVRNGHKKEHIHIACFNVWLDVADDVYEAERTGHRAKYIFPRGISETG